MDIVVTPANVLASPDGSAHSTFGIAGVNITAGQPIYLDPNTNTFKLAGAEVAGIGSVQILFAQNNAAVGQPVKACFQDAGFQHGGAGLAIGDVLFLSTNPGNMTKTQADVEVTGAVVIVLAVATSATLMKFQQINSGVPHA